MNIIVGGTIFAIFAICTTFVALITGAYLNNINKF